MLPETTHPQAARAHVATLRERVLLPARFRLLLLGMVSCLLLGLCGVLLTLIANTFGTVGASLRDALDRQARRGAYELALAAADGVRRGDSEAVGSALRALRDDPDVQAAVAVDDEGNALAVVGALSEPLASLFTGEPGQVRDASDVLVAWSPVVANGQVVAKVAVLLRKARLLVAVDLLRHLLLAGLGACVLALLLATVFVHFYLAPLVQASESAFDELEHIADSALEAAHLKNEYIAGLSHALCAPLDAAIGLAGLVQRDSTTDRQARWARTLVTAVAEVRSTLGDLVALAHVEAGTLLIKSSVVETRALVAAALAGVEAQASAKGLLLRAEVADDVPLVVRADAARLQQVLAHLLRNAIAFTERGGVTLSLRRDRIEPRGLMLRFQVEDTGIGIAPSEHDQLFAAFAARAGSPPRRFGGTGLGLALCKELAALMGGHMGLHSTPGRGSAFWFSVCVGTLDGDSMPADAAPLTILAAGLDADLQAGLATALASRQVALHAVRDGAGVLAALRITSHFHLVLIDAEAPGCGLLLSRTLQSDPAMGAQPLVMLAEPQRAYIGAQSGAAACLFKPLDGLELADALCSMLPGWAPAPRRAALSGTLSEVADAILDAAVARRAGSVEAFLQAAPGAMDQLRQAATSADLMGIKRQAHRLKSTCLALGASQMLQTCRVLESVADAAQAASLIEQLQAQYRVTQEALFAERQRLA